MKRIFIYYSLSGNGDSVANYLKNKKIDIRKVDIIKKDKLSNNMFFKILTGGFKAVIGYKDKLLEFDSNIEKYDEIIIGSPIWNSRLSSPINSVLDILKLKDKKITFILYSGSGELNKATKKIMKEYPLARIVNLKEPIKNSNEFKKLENI